MMRSRPSPRVVKFHAPEMIIGEGALAERHSRRPDSACASRCSSRMSGRGHGLVRRVDLTDRSGRATGTVLHRCLTESAGGEITAAFERYERYTCDGIIALGGDR